MFDRVELTTNPAQLNRIYDVGVPKYRRKQSEAWRYPCITPSVADVAISHCRDPA